LNDNAERPAAEMQFSVALSNISLNFPPACDHFYHGEFERISAPTGHARHFPFTCVTNVVPQEGIRPLLIPQLATLPATSWLHVQHPSWQHPILRARDETDEIVAYTVQVGFPGC
jgi:hypothetical protein